ncbi:hypothetical protein C8R43DRAFT_946601 [Mycena crocata]|nr:hypothetical protein C8R43DRAFT_946601 [Mycena crocata]
MPSPSREEMLIKGDTSTTALFIAALYDHIILKSRETALRAFAHAIEAQQADIASSDVPPPLIPDDCPVTHYRGRVVVIPEGFTAESFHAFIAGEGFDGTVDLPRRDEDVEPAEEILMPAPYTPVDLPHLINPPHFHVHAHVHAHGPLTYPLLIADGEAVERPFVGMSGSGIPPSVIAHFYRDHPNHPALIDNPFRLGTFDGESIENENSNDAYNSFWVRNAATANRIRAIREQEQGQLDEENARRTVLATSAMNPRRAEFLEPAQTQLDAEDTHRIVVATELQDIEAAEASWARVMCEVNRMQHVLAERDSQRAIEPRPGALELGEGGADAVGDGVGKPSEDGDEWRDSQRGDSACGDKDWRGDLGGVWLRLTQSGAASLFDAEHRGVLHDSGHYAAAPLPCTRFGAASGPKSVAGVDFGERIRTAPCVRGPCKNAKRSGLLLPIPRLGAGGRFARCRRHPRAGEGC